MFHGLHSLLISKRKRFCASGTDTMLLVLNRANKGSTLIPFFHAGIVDWLHVLSLVSRPGARARLWDSWSTGLSIQDLVDANQLVDVQSDACGMPHIKPGISKFKTRKWTSFQHFNIMLCIIPVFQLLNSAMAYLNALVVVGACNLVGFGISFKTRIAVCDNFVCWGHRIERYAHHIADRQVKSSSSTTAWDRLGAGSTALGCPACLNQMYTEQIDGN